MLFSEMTHEMFMTLSFEIGWTQGDLGLSWSRSDLMGLSVDDLITYAVMAQKRRKEYSEAVKAQRSKTHR